MNVHHILLNDNNPLHQELSIYRTGSINHIKLTDRSYHTYGVLEIDGHNYAALFHYELPAHLNSLPFISESNNGLESWDEAILHHSALPELLLLLEQQKNIICTKKIETIIVGWQDQPVGIAYLRTIDPTQFLHFFALLQAFIQQALANQFDLEFVL